MEHYRKICLLILSTVLLSVNVLSQVQINGQLVNEKGEPVEFANIVLQSPDNFFGAVSGEQGEFAMQVSAGNYSLKISVMGYEPMEKELSVEQNADLGKIILSLTAVEIGEVVVRANRIVRRSDRFIINLANDPTVFGKTGSDMLLLSPGVFLNERDGTVSINGKSGTRVMVNGRLLHEQGEELIRYLQTLKAEDILRIEILPSGGAGYDADIAGGVVSIALKRLRDDGMNGSAGVSYALAAGEDVFSLNPSYSMNYKNNRLSLYAMLNYDDKHTIEHATEHATFTDMDRNLQSSLELPITLRSGHVRIGGIYEVSERQSVGLELYTSRDGRNNSSYTDLTETTGDNRTDITSVYKGKNSINNRAASANYMLRIDSVGSLFKVLLDYHHSETDDRQDYRSEYRGYLSHDSVYRSGMVTQNNLYAINADLELRLNARTTLGTGLKYTRNEMDNSILFEYEKEMLWNENGAYSSENAFAENIAAIYGVLSSRIGGVGYSVGLRGEYTHASPWTNKSEQTEVQRYFQLFPTVNFMIPVGKDGSHSLVVDYNRKIRRPSFSNLNPYRLPLSEYAFVEGNPRLHAALSNDFSVAMSLFNKYSLAVGVTDTKGSFNRISTADPDLPGVMILRVDNVARSTTWYVSVNVPLQIAPWWRINMNLSGRKNNIEIFGDRRTIHTMQGYMVHSFALPGNYSFDVDGFYLSPFLEGNVKTEIGSQVNASLRKQFFNKQLSGSFFVNNLFDTGTAKLYVNEDDFHRSVRSQYNFREFGVSLRYSFSAGKSVRVKKVETGAAEEKARLQ
jgi:hypothetical protein